MSETFEESHDLFKLKPRHKWFSAESDDAEIWYGPFKSIDQAAERAAAEEPDGRIFIAQGRRTIAKEREEWGVDYAWQVDDSQNAFEITHKHNITQPRKNHERPA